MKQVTITKKDLEHALRARFKVSLDPLSQAEEAMIILLLKPKQRNKGGETMGIQLTDKEICAAIYDQILHVSDANDLATFVGDLFGGKCFYQGDGLYEFTPNLNLYCGGPINAN